MIEVNRKITTYNRTERTDKKNQWLVIHYVGKESTAKNNAYYFASMYVGASATYFVDEISIWQAVEEYDNAWHVGGAKTYYNGCRNSNSIGIEMCCKKRDDKWYIEPATIENTIELSVQIMRKYKIDINHVTRHYDVTHKVCPEPFVRDEQAWLDFKKRIQQRLEEKDMEQEMEEKTVQEKCQKIAEVANLDENTLQYFQFYRYNVPLIDKLYKMAVDAENWRNR